MRDPMAEEQRYVDRLYQRLRELRTTTAARLAEVRLQQTRHHQGLFERDVEARHLEAALARYEVGGAALCFGRLDLESGLTHYIGRVGLSDADQETLLVDWRAPAAEPFYRATARNPEGVARRRHLLCEGPRLVGIDDELFDAAALADVDDRNLRGEAALLAALARRRTGRMTDIVATIQSAQDAVIRAPLEGTLLVQGGPGTGKTAVALHRAAYLLYTHRARLAAQGVLILGPSRVFLRYIEQVLPSLGETGAVLARVGDLFPGVAARGADSPRAARAKGLASMSTVLERAVRMRQRGLREDAAIGFGAVQLVVTPQLAADARRRARRRRVTHNRARPTFEAALLDALVDQAVEKERPLGRSGGGARRTEIRTAVRRSRDFRTLLLRLWPVLTPAELLSDLYSSRVLLRAAGKGIFTKEDVAALHRAKVAEAAWTPADVPLLDEAAELLGDPPSPPRRRRRRPAPAGNGAATTPGLERLLGEGGADLGELAMADRTWRFGHVIVDEAQEVSPMAWRTIARRCPQLSMTVVGDWAQRSVDWGASGWRGVLGPAAARLRVADLTVNYRTPEEAMRVAAAVLAVADPDATAPEAVRSSGFAPWALPVGAGGLPDVVAAVAAGEARAVSGGRVAVVVPAELHDAVAVSLRRAMAADVAIDEAAALERTVAVLPVAAVKGLEFDSVVVVEPAAIAGASARGANDLYVALTRTTGRLGVVHARALPEWMHGLRLVDGIAAIDA